MKRSVRLLYVLYILVLAWTTLVCEFASFANWKPAFRATSFGRLIHAACVPLDFLLLILGVIAVVRAPSVACEFYRALGALCAFVGGVTIVQSVWTVVFVRSAEATEILLGPTNFGVVGAAILAAFGLAFHRAVPEEVRPA